MCIDISNEIEEIRISAEKYIEIAERRLREYFNYLEIREKNIINIVKMIKTVLEHKEWIYLPFLDRNEEIPFIYSPDQLLEFDNKIYLTKNIYNSDKDTCILEGGQEVPLSFKTLDELEIQLKFLGKWTKKPVRIGEYFDYNFDETDWENREKEDNKKYYYCGKLNINLMKNNNIMYSKDKKIGIEDIFTSRRNLNNIIIEDINTLKALYITLKKTFKESWENNWVTEIIIIKNTEINLQHIKLSKVIGNVVVLLDCNISKSKQLQEMNQILSRVYLIEELKTISWLGKNLTYTSIGRSIKNISEILSPIKKEWGNAVVDWFGDDDDSDELWILEEKIGLGNMNHLVDVLEVVEELRKEI